MSHSNPYEPPQAACEVPTVTTSPSVMKRVAWSIGCLMLGVGLGLGLPEFLAIPVVIGASGSGQDWSGLILILFIDIACVISGLFGIIVGAVLPGKQSVILTLKCLLFTDIISIVGCLFFRDGGSRFIPLYLVSAVIKAVLIFGLNRIGVAH